MFAIQFELFFPEWPGIYICRQEISRSRGSARAGFAEGLEYLLFACGKDWDGRLWGTIGRRWGSGGK